MTTESLEKGQELLNQIKECDEGIKNLEETRSLTIYTTDRICSHTRTYEVRAPLPNERIMEKARLQLLAIVKEERALLQQEFDNL